MYQNQEMRGQVLQRLTGDENGKQNEEGIGNRKKMAQGSDLQGLEEVGDIVLTTPLGRKVSTATIKIRPHQNAPLQ